MEKTEKALLVILPSPIKDSGEADPNRWKDAYKIVKNRQRVYEKEKTAQRGLGETGRIAGIANEALNSGNSSYGTVSSILGAGKTVEFGAKNIPRDLYTHDLIESFEARRYKVFPFQVNPSSVKISAGSTDSTKDSGKAKDAEIPQRVGATNLYLSCSVIFTSGVYAGIGMSSNMSSLGKMEFHSLTDGHLSRGGVFEEADVQSKVEGLISLMLEGKENEVMFCFGKTNFVGVLSNISYRYTLFDRLGKPLRAEVDIKIEERIVGVSDSYWNEAFDKKFE